MLARLTLAGALAAALLAPAASAAQHGGFDLLSEQEYHSELSARQAPGAMLIPKAADFDAPAIMVVKPDAKAPIQPPVDIDVRFTPASGATVNIASLKIMYGFLKLDITRRILDAPGVKVSPAGLSASGARLPSGSHKLVIEVADSLGRTARQVLTFTVK